MTATPASAETGIGALAASSLARRPRVRLSWVAVGVLAVGASGLAGLTIGAVSMPSLRVLAEVVDHLPWIHVRSGLTAQQATIVWELRLPRVVLAMLVGGMLAMSGASFQGSFRNPLADPYLLGAAAGAGLGATIAVVSGIVSDLDTGGAIPLFAFAGALGAVFLAYALSSVGAVDRSPAVLLLAGVAVAAFLTALQTFLLQQHADSIRVVYTWMLGHLTTAGWHEVTSTLPYALAAGVVLLSQRRALDVLSVGDDEAAALGLDVRRSRFLIVVAAALATAAAVSVSGLIGFVGLVVPHTVRLVVGSSYRVILPLSILFGAAFLTLADIIARTVLAPSEIPIGVVTAVAGAPFFALLLRSRRRFA